MSKKPAVIAKSFFAAPATAQPAPLVKTVEEPITKAQTVDTPAKRKAPVVANDPEEGKITLGFKVTPTFKWELKAYATRLRKSQHEVMMEALDLHRAKYEKR